ncbi:MAG: hypothetical protein IJN42_02305 [Clostridia bacterium]|nr:hypothetical protein [Clostridia bacterium]
MEGYIEQVVQQRMNFETQVKRFFLTVLPILAAILLITSNVPPIFRVFVFLAVIGLAYLSYKMFMNFYIEWEYTFVTNEVSFARIHNKSKRKDLLTCQVKDTIVLAKSTDEEHLSTVPKNAKKYSFLSNTGTDYYVWALQGKNGKNICIYFEPNEKMLNSIYTLARSKVFK